MKKPTVKELKPLIDKVIENARFLEWAKYKGYVWAEDLNAWIIKQYPYWAITKPMDAVYADFQKTIK